MGFQKVFRGDGDPFDAKRKAERWLKDRGYSFGPSCSHGPQAIIARPGVLVAKWRNLTAQEQGAVDGILTAGRNMLAVVDLNEPPPEACGGE